MSPVVAAVAVVGELSALTLGEVGVGTAIVGPFGISREVIRRNEIADPFRNLPVVAMGDHEILLVEKRSAAAGRAELEMDVFEGLEERIRVNPLQAEQVVDFALQALEALLN